MAKECSACFGCGTPVPVPNARGEHSGLAIKFTNPDCPVHGKHGRKRAREESDAKRA